MPSPPPPDNSAALCDVSRLKRWIGQLPLMSVVETVGKLHESIRALSQARLAEGERCKLLEAYRQAFDDILFTYDEFRLKLLPLTAKARGQLATDIMRLYLALADGYKVLVYGGNEQARNPAEDAAVLLAVYRAMELMNLAAIFARRMRLDVPAGTWLELHRLYWLADGNRAAGIKIRAVRRECTEPTVDRLYKQFWLLHVAEVQGLSGAEWLELYWLLEGFAPKCRLMSGTPAEHQKGVYQIDLMADAPATLFDAGCTLRQPRLLDINPALAAMNAWLAERQSKPKSCDGHEARLLAMHMEHLGAGQGRKVCRVAFARNTRVALGLPSLRYFLEDKARLLAACEAEVQRGGNSHHAANAEMPSLCDWTIQDESEIGCQLLGKSMPQGEVPLLGNVLGVVGFEHSPSHSILSVGIVRWVKEDAKDKHLQRLGVEIVAGEAQPIVFALTPKALATAPQSALYFPKDCEGGRPASLLLPRDVVASTIRLHVAVRGKSFEVNLHSVVRESPLFVQCRFKVARG